MVSVVGVFQSRENAEQSATSLLPVGISKEKINILTPQVSDKEIDKELAAVPSSEGEQPGMVKTLGAVAGGAVGLGLGEALASLLVPGVGPVLAIGLAGGALLGAIGGGAAGKVMESSVFANIPEEELFVYHDALKHGRTVVIVLAENEKQAEAARGALERGGAETIDRAREMWWVGLRDVEKETYTASGGDFQKDERYFRRGFEAALHSRKESKSYEQAYAQIGETSMQESEAFKRGYDRGRAYLEAIAKPQNVENAQNAQNALNAKNVASGKNR